MAFDEHIHPKVAQKLLTVFLDADIHYHMNGTPHHVYLERQSGRHLGQARRLLWQVACLGDEGAQRWMAYFIEGMNDESGVAE